MAVTFKPCVVFDLDNTIIDYNDAFYEHAVRNCWVDTKTTRSKMGVKAQIFSKFSSKEAQQKWLQLQHHCYTSAIWNIEISDSVFKLFDFLKNQGFEIFIISHKSSLSYYDNQTDLREVALRYLKRYKITENIFFTETLDEKIDLISKKDPVFIIDDLPEVIESQKLRHKKTILFSGEVASRVGFSNWNSIFNFMKLLPLSTDFEISKIQTSSKNSIFKITNLQKPYIIKVYGEVAAAENEYNILSFLHCRNPGQVPKPLGREGNAVALEYIEPSGSCSLAGAYEQLNLFLEKNKNVDLLWAAPDDHNSTNEYLKKISLRWKKLCLPNSLSESISLLLKSLEERPDFLFDPGKRRFVLPDFNPTNLIFSDRGAYFIDFEHAGQAHPERFLCNLMLHPKSKIDRNAFTESCRIMGVQQSDLETVFPFSFVEWILIILGFLNPDDVSHSAKPLTESEKALRYEEGLKRINFFLQNCSGSRSLYDHFHERLFGALP